MSSSSPSQNSASSSPSHNSASYVRSVVGLTIISAKLIPGLEVAATIAQSIDEQARKLKNNRETCKALVEQVRISQTTLEKYKPNYDDFQDAYKQYIDILKKIEDYIKQLRKPGNFSRQFINKITRYIHAKEDEELLKQFMDTLTQATNAFNLEVSVQMYNEISKMSTQMHKLEISHIVKGLDARPSDIEKTRIKPDLIANDPSKEKVVRGKALVKKMYRSQPVAVRRTVDEYSRIEKELKTKLDKEAVIRKLLSDCNNIEKFHGTVVDSNYLSIVTEWAENGNLCDYLQKEPNIRWIDKWRIASEIGNAVNFCHGVEVLHHNIRAKNVLLDEHLTAKLSNFGTSRLIDQSTTTIPGLRDGLEWKAPEKIRSEVERRKHDEEQKKTNNIKYDFNKKTGKRRKISDEEKKEINNIKHEPLPFNKQMDVYSFAITLWELAANGKSPFSEITSSELEDAIIAGARPLIPDNTPPKFEVFIKEAWDNKGDRRPKIDVIATNLVKNYQLLKENYQTKNCLTIPPSTPQRSLTPELSLSESPNNSQSAFTELTTLPSFEEIFKMHNEKKYEEALPYFEAYAEKGDPRGAYFVGKYLCEVDKLRDEERGLALIQQAADAERQAGKNEINEYILKAQAYYGKALLQRTYQLKKAFHYLELASSNRRYDADCILAEIYMEGEYGKEIDLKKSEKYLEKIFASKTLPKDGPIHEQAKKLFARLSEYKTEAEINNDEKDSIKSDPASRVY